MPKTKKDKRKDMNHLTQPNKRFRWTLDFYYKRGIGKGEYEIRCDEEVEFEMEPVVCNGIKTWRSVEPDESRDQQRFELWLKRNKNGYGRSISKWEAIETFKSKELFAMCYQNIEQGNDTQEWNDTLNKLRDDSDRLDVEKAKQYPIEQLVRQFGFEPRMNFLVCPFHDDSNRSLKIYPNNNTWYCYGCNSGSSTVDFVMKMNKCGFVRAVKYLT